MRFYNLMHHIKQASIFSVLLALAGSSYAASGVENNKFSYDFVEFRFVDFDADDGADGDGFFINGSFRLDNNIFIT